MLKQMPAGVYLDWVELYEESPDVGRRVDFGAAMVSSTVFNMLRRKGKHGKLKDFLIDWIVRPVKKSSEDLLKKVEFLNKLFKGKDLRKNKK